MAIQRNGNNLVYGLGNPLASLPQQNIVSKRVPTSADSAEVGTLWLYVNAPTVQIYIFAYSGTWVELPTDGGSGIFTGLTVTGVSSLTGQTTIAVAADAFNLTSTSGAINIGANSSAHPIVIGNATGASSVTINSGTGGITLNSNSTGKISLVSAAATAAAFTVTNNALIGSCTLTGQTIASTASQAITLNNSNITISKSVMVNVSSLNASGNGAYLEVVGVIQAAGSLVINVKNNSGANLAAADTIIIGFIVLG